MSTHRASAPIFYAAATSYNKFMMELRTGDVAIAGGGIIGLSIGMELQCRGLSVIVIERDRAMRGASWAAGGMLAGRDPANPPALCLLALRSLELYPDYLHRVEELSGESVPLRTRRALLEISGEHATRGETTPAAESEAMEWIPGLNIAGHKLVWMDEDSLDPRDLCRALPKAFCAAGGTLLEASPVLAVEPRASEIAVTTPSETIHATHFINCCGAWAGAAHLGELPVVPVKGQMVSAAIAAERLRCVLRTPRFYAIPRGDGRVTVGATVERVGFDTTVYPEQIAELLQNAAEMIPEIARAPVLQSWAGLRPGTPDDLPILGAASAEHCWVATGHYRDGILLAPATARVMAQAIMEEPLDVSIAEFSATRFKVASTGATIAASAIAAN